MRSAPEVQKAHKLLSCRSVTSLDNWRSITGSPTSLLFHSLYNIILRLASICRSTFTNINSAALNNKNNAKFDTKSKYKTPWTIVLHLQMVF